MRFLDPRIDIDLFINHFATIPWNFLSREYRVARQAHPCRWCCIIIRPGDRYVLTHLQCSTTGEPHESDERIYFRVCRDARLCMFRELMSSGFPRTERYIFHNKLAYQERDSLKAAILKALV